MISGYNCKDCREIWNQEPIRCPACSGTNVEGGPPGSGPDSLPADFEGHRDQIAGVILDERRTLNQKVDAIFVYLRGAEGERQP